MKKTKIWQFCGFVFTSLMGTLLHFLYDLTNQNSFAALFSATNESTWEHMKLLFFPMLLFASVESVFISENRSSFWCIKLRGIVLGLVLIPTLFYTYTGAFGISSDFINITIFFVTAAITFLWETRALKQNNTQCKYPTLAIITLCVISFLFFKFTFDVPQLPLFQDPASIM